MRVSTSSALVALLITYVSGSPISTHAAGCSAESIVTGEDVFLKQLSFATYKACAQWSRNDNNATAFNSPPFKLSFARTVEPTNNDTCVSAFKTIIKDCTGDIIFGGSITSQGIDYTIARTEIDPGLHSELVARGRARGASGASRKKVQEPKTPKKTKTTSKKPKKALKKLKKKIPTKTEKKTEKQPENSKTCKVRPDKNGRKSSKGAKDVGRGPLTGRAILLDLIKRVNGKGKKAQKGDGKATGEKKASSSWGSRKHYKYGKNGKSLVSDTYPAQKALPKDVEQFGTSTEEPLKGMFGHKDELNQEEVAAQDVEHVLEWHNVGEFLEKEYGEKIEKYLPANLKDLEGKTDECDEFEITVEGVKHTGTLSKVIAQAYPGTKHSKDEFVLLDKYSNEHIKQGAFSDKVLVSDQSFNGHELEHLQNVFVVGKYLVHSTINKFFQREVNRMGKAMDAIEKELLAKKISPETKGGLENAWKTYMSKTWGDAESRLTDFMNEKIIALKGKWECSFEVKIHGQGEVMEPNPEDAPNPMENDKCRALEYIHDKWVFFVRDHLSARPWEKTSTPAASLGNKRLKLNQKPSNTDSHDDKKHEPGSRSTSGAN